MRTVELFTVTPLFITLFCLVFRDCMKGDETENKKIGCTVNLLVRVMFELFLNNLLIFTLDYCSTVTTASTANLLVFTSI